MKENIEKQNGSAFEAGVSFYTSRISETIEKIIQSSLPEDSIMNLTLLEEKELFELKLNQLVRRHDLQLI